MPILAGGESARPDPQKLLVHGSRDLSADNEYVLLGLRPDQAMKQFWSRGDAAEDVRGVYDM